MYMIWIFGLPPARLYSKLPPGLVGTTALLLADSIYRGIWL